MKKIKDSEFIFNVLEQKNISQKNVNQLETISQRYNDEIGKKAKAISLAGKVHPARKKRLGHLYSKHRKIFDELVRLEIIEDSITPRIEEEERFEREYEKWKNTENYDDTGYNNKDEIDEYCFNDVPDEELPF